LGESFFCTLFLPLELAHGIQWTYYSALKEEFPEDVTKFDLLIVCGSIATAYEDDQYPWLTTLRGNLSQVIGSAKILGI
jgi:hypothetical protein